MWGATLMLYYITGTGLDPTYEMRIDGLRLPQTDTEISCDVNIVDRNVISI